MKANPVAVLLVGLLTVAACPGRGAVRACSILEALTDAERGDDGVGRGEGPCI